MKSLIERFVREDAGQDLVEYAFLLAFIALIAAVGVGILGRGVNTLFSGINGQLNAAGGT
jgi:Flp pilus assembly pilin Flp